MWKKYLTVSAIMLFLLVGCNKEKEVVEQEEKVTEQQEEVEEEQNIEETLPYQYPYTGIGSEEEVTGRAVAVVVNNHPKARPQSGLHQADIVYEILAEGNVTRFLAIFQSEQPKKIGPVRSAREYYVRLAKGYDSLFIAHGYSPDAKEMLLGGYIDNLNGMEYDGSLFKRSSDRVAPHNSYISFENILKGADRNGYEMENAPETHSFLNEEEVENLNGEVANNISISYYDNTFSSTFEYDESLEKYYRFSNNEQTVDKESKDPVLVSNIMVIETPHNVIDSAGRREIDLTSGGKGYLFQKGQLTEVEWKNVEGEILPYKNGEVVGFVPGKTWINIIPTSPGIEKAVTFD